MAWKLAPYLLEGGLDNAQPGKVKGWLNILGIDRQIVLDLEGDFDPDIRGAKLRLVGRSHEEEQDVSMHIRGLARRQTGKVGQVRLIPIMGTERKHVHIEWQSEQNGRVVIEFEPSQISPGVDKATTTRENGMSAQMADRVIVCVLPRGEDAREDAASSSL